MLLFPRKYFDNLTLLSYILAGMFLREALLCCFLSMFEIPHLIYLINIFFQYISHSFSRGIPLKISCTDELIQVSFSAFNV